MTIIASAILAAAVMILVITVIGMARWQKKSEAQMAALEKIEKHLATVEKALKIRIKQAEAASAHSLTETSQQAEEQETEKKRPLEEKSSSPDDAKSGSGRNAELKREVLKDLEREREKITQTPKNETKKQEGRETEPSDRGSEAPATSIYNIGKSGKIYTEEELELLIKE